MAFEAGLSAEKHVHMTSTALHKHSRQLTQTLQEEMNRVLRDIQGADLRKTREQQNQLRDMLRFYHQHEGDIYDVCNSLRDQDRQVARLQTRRQKLNDLVNRQFKELKNKKESLFEARETDNAELIRLKSDLRARLTENLRLKVRVETERAASVTLKERNRELLDKEKNKTKQLLRILANLQTQVHNQGRHPELELSRLQQDTRTAMQRQHSMKSQLEEVLQIQAKVEASIENLTMARHRLDGFANVVEQAAQEKKILASEDFNDRLEALGEASIELANEFCVHQKHAEKVFQCDACSKPLLPKDFVSLQWADGGSLCAVCVMAKRAQISPEEFAKEHSPPSQLVKQAQEKDQNETPPVDVATLLQAKWGLLVEAGVVANSSDMAAMSKLARALQRPEVEINPLYQKQLLTVPSLRDMVDYRGPEQPPPHDAHDTHMERVIAQFGKQQADINAFHTYCRLSPLFLQALRSKKEQDERSQASLASVDKQLQAHLMPLMPPNAEQP